MSRVCGWFRSLLLWTGVSVAGLLLVAVALLHPPMQAYYSPFTLQHPYAHLPTWGVQELYHNTITRDVLFKHHQDRVVDWAQPTALYQMGEKIATWSATHNSTARERRIILSDTIGGNARRDGAANGRVSRAAQ